MGNSYNKFKKLSPNRFPKNCNPNVKEYLMQLGICFDDYHDNNKYTTRVCLPQGYGLFEVYTDGYALWTGFLLNHEKKPIVQFFWYKKNYNCYMTLPKNDLTLKTANAVLDNGWYTTEYF